MNGIAPHCSALKVLYIAHNKVKDWNEIEKIKDLQSLNNVVFLGNDIYETFPNKEEARIWVLKTLNRMEMIDNVLVTGKDHDDVKRIYAEE